MPELVKLLIRSCGVGFALSGVLVVCMWLFNAGNFAALTGGPGGWVGVLMLFAFAGTTFSSTQISIAVMQAGEDDTRPGSGLSVGLIFDRLHRRLAAAPARRGTITFDGSTFDAAPADPIRHSPPQLVPG